MQLFSVLKAWVAPFMGAWIETFGWGCYSFYRRVAPFMGAWIETSQEVKYYEQQLVAPFMGAWIETI